MCKIVCVGRGAGIEGTDWSTNFFRVAGRKKKGALVKSLLVCTIVDVSCGHFIFTMRSTVMCCHRILFDNISMDKITKFGPSKKSNHS